MEKEIKKQFIKYIEKELAKVKVRFRVMRDELNLENPDIDGVYDNKSNTIWINKNIGEKKKIREILLHEIFEWIFWRLFSSTKDYWDIPLEEIELEDAYYVIKHSDIDKIVRKIR